MEEIPSLFENRLFLATFSLISGAIIAIVIRYWTNKTGVFGYVANSNVVGLSTDHAIFGSFRATWEDTAVRNLHMFNIEVENLSMRDYEDIVFTIYSESATFLLNESTEFVGTPYALEHSEKYRDSVFPSDGSKQTAEQNDLYLHRREYHLPVFNREQKIRLSYICTKPNDDDGPDVFIETPSKGVKLRKLQNPYAIINPIWGAPIPAVIPRAFLIAIVVLVSNGLIFENVWIASSVSMLVGLTAQVFGALLYKLEKLVKRAVAG